VSAVERAGEQPRNKKQLARTAGTPPNLIVSFRFF
jgi:hypothetical protein